jgi:glycosyltransferase involved in cell wall biosynthesis
MAADAVPAKRLRVVVDALNRDLAQGTGINTYARMLHEALAELGHRPSWLFGRASAGAGDPVAAEVTFHDPPTPTVGLRRQLQAAGRLWRGATQARIAADRLAPQGVVVAGEAEPGLEGSFNAPELYRQAAFRHELMGKFTEAALPEPVDIFHQTTPLPVSVAGARLVSSIPDLIPLRLPATTPDDKERYLRLVRECAARASLITTLSEASKDDIVRLLGVAPEKVAVTYLTSDIRPLSPEDAGRTPRVLEKFGLTSGGYLLFVGAIEPKKNLRRLIEAYLEIDTEQPLVIVGRKAWMWEQEIGHIEALGERARRRLVFPGYVGRGDLPFLYAGATALAFPSLYEGFGLPPVEAMTMGCPVLTSDVAPLKEVCGEAALFADPYSSADIRRQLERLIGDAELRGRLSAAGLARAGEFSRERFVERLGRAYALLS